MLLSSDDLFQELGIASQRVNVSLTGGLGQNRLQEGG